MHDRIGTRRQGHPRMRWRLLLAGTFVPAAMSAQRTVRVDVDNDAFNFWQPSPSRADREYTQGIRVMALTPTTWRGAARLLGGRGDCDIASVSSDCRFVSLGVAQEIYTPTLNTRRRTTGERPFAGFLGVDAGLRREWDRGMRAVGATLGMTGAPSLAEPAQKAVHSLLGFPAPIGWDTQLPTEVAGLVRVEVAQAIARARLAGGWGVVLAPQAQVRAGTLATDATVGLHIVAGLRAPAPWQHAMPSGRDPWGAYVRGGVAQAAVLRNLFLDGTQFRTSASVPKNRTVRELSVAVGIRGPRASVEWQVHQLTREYPAQPVAHAYSSFVFVLH